MEVIAPLAVIVIFAVCMFVYYYSNRHTDMTHIDAGLGFLFAELRDRWKARKPDRNHAPDEFVVVRSYADIIKDKKTLLGEVKDE